MARVLVCGGRRFTDAAWLTTILDRHHINVLITGMASGADTLAWLYAIRLGIKVDAYPADWEKHKLAAGPIRNYQMLKEGKPDLVIAFPGGKGTAHMVSIARKAKVQVIEIEA